MIPRAISFPHVGGRRANLDWHYPALEKLIEVGSSWGHFPWFFQDAVARGYQLGASAAGDEHRGRCGGGVPGTAVFGTKGGLTGVLAPTLSRTDIGSALRARHTWATTGERLVGLIASSGYVQGDAFSRAGQASIGYRFLGMPGGIRSRPTTIPASSGNAICSAKRATASGASASAATPMAMPTPLKSMRAIWLMP
ncbi:MAG: uncharacterized protein JWM91_1288 [Rhodospirillales bacterium]|nr:uncharacterized protein [Rhodospirillales bacterium]